MRRINTSFQVSSLSCFLYDVVFTYLSHLFPDLLCCLFSKTFAYVFLFFVATLYMFFCSSVIQFHLSVFVIINHDEFSGSFPICRN
jgi:hypothetical protein